MFSSNAKLNRNAFTATCGMDELRAIEFNGATEPPLMNLGGTNIYKHHQNLLRQYTGQFF